MNSVTRSIDTLTAPFGGPTGRHAVVLLVAVLFGTIGLVSAGSGLASATGVEPGGGWSSVGPTHPSPTMGRDAADPDTDGLSTRLERTLGTDPYDPDTDGDRLTDGREVRVYGTDPTAADSDDDGIRDNRELYLGTDPTAADTDGDGVPDGYEQQLGLSPRLADSDRDGVSDRIEVYLRANSVTQTSDESVNAVTLQQDGIIDAPPIPPLEETLLAVGVLAVLTVGIRMIRRWYRRYTSPVIVKTD